MASHAWDGFGRCSVCGYRAQTTGDGASTCPILSKPREKDELEAAQKEIERLRSALGLLATGEWLLGTDGDLPCLTRVRGFARAALTPRINSPKSTEPKCNCGAEALGPYRAHPPSCALYPALKSTERCDHTRDLRKACPECPPGTHGAGTQKKEGVSHG
jgi:hypothetical protein